MEFLASRGSLTPRGGWGDDLGPGDRKGGLMGIGRIPSPEEGGAALRPGGGWCWWQASVTPSTRSIRQPSAPAAVAQTGGGWCWQTAVEPPPPELEAATRAIVEPSAPAAV